MSNFWGDDGYDADRRRRPSPHHMRTDYREDFLNPGMGSGLYRSRSQGHGPAPTINVYNRMTQDQDNRSPSPYLPYPSASRRASPRASPEFRGRTRLGDDLVENLAEMALDQRYRSRSRGRSDFSDAGLAEWQLAQKEQEIRDIESRRQWEREEERIRNNYKLKQMQDELKREKDEDNAKDLRKRIEQEYDRKQREEKDRVKEEEQRIKDKIEKDKRDEKARAEREEREFLQRQEDKKKEEERQYDEFLRKQKEKEEKKKKEEKEKEELIQNEMRKRLAALGYTSKTIDIMVDEEKAKKFKTDVERRDDRMETFQRRSDRAPIYPKVHRDYLAVETLRYYDLPWEYDRANPEYIIILRDMSKHDTDVLFEHTSRMRSKLLLEAPKEKKEYAWVRKRSKSRGAGARVGILKIERS